MRVRCEDASKAAHVDLSVVGFPNWRDLIETGQIDLALTVSGDPPPSAFSTQELFADDFVCMVRRGHPLVKKKLSLGAKASISRPAASAPSIYAIAFASVNAAFTLLIVPAGISLSTKPGGVLLLLVVVPELVAHGAEVPST